MQPPGEVKRIIIGLAILLTLTTLLGVTTSILQGVDMKTALRTGFYNVFFPKAGENKTNNPIIGVLYLITAFISIGIIYYIIEDIINIAIRTDIKQTLTVWKIRKMKNHVIIFGGGTMGEHAAKELTNKKTPFIIIEKNKERAQHLRQKGYKTLEGDALNEETLRKAKIHQAKAAIITFSDPGDALLITLTLKQQSPTITIGARANDLTITKKLKTAGADHVVMPEFESANKLVDILETNK